MTGVNKLFIVTGSSRGLGQELARQLTRFGQSVIGVARGKYSNDEMFETLFCDLANSENVLLLVKSLRKRVLGFDSVVLINNAGVIEPIGKVGELNDPETVSQHIGVNYLGPVLLVNGLLAVLNDDVNFQIINITSGAAERPIQGWSLYSSSKKAFKVFLDVVVTENEQVKVTHFDPGIMDTSMQQTIRDSDVDDFPDLEQFRNFKLIGKLQPASTVAKQMIESLVNL